MSTDQDVRIAVARLDSWLDTMRGPDGYTGPVAHWWQNCLMYTGLGLDWRYEGIIHGYVTLFERTGDRCWLDKARRAGDDLLAGQLPSGHFVSSSFELNPYVGGTPHEAACDLALLTLAEVLRAQGQDDWRRYHGAADRNARAAQIGRLWDPAERRLRDDPGVPTFVPNKAATFAEAILALARGSDDGDMLVERYALPTLDEVLAHQISTGPLRGGIWQNTYAGRRVEKLFPFYVARCVPGLVAGYEASGDDRYLASAIDALDFVVRCRDADGGFPQVIYGDGSANVYPRWIAGAADVLRAIVLAGRYGYRAELEPTLSWLLSAQSPSGAFPTAHGFAAQMSGRRPPSTPSFRDLLPVVGWNDKVFRLLTSLLPDSAELPAGGSERYEAACEVEGTLGHWSETSESLELRLGSDVVYGWTKGAPWASVAVPEVAWK
jgi:hypothetical protein